MSFLLFPAALLLDLLVTHVPLCQEGACLTAIGKGNRLLSSVRFPALHQQRTIAARLKYLIMGWLDWTVRLVGWVSSCSSSKEARGSL